MSLKAELETWAAALQAYDEEDFEKSLDMFSRIADSSKILTNMGLIYATLGEHEAAVEQFAAATGLDNYLAVAYFQCGVSNFLLGRYELSAKDFEDALLYLRGNQSIDYTQLGLSLIYLGKTQEGLAHLEDAVKEKTTEEHNVIDEAIRDRGEGYTVFSIPVGILYRPSEAKLKNAKTRDFLGKAKLVASENPNEAYTTFTGVTRLRQGVTPQGVWVDPQPGEDGALARAATTGRIRGPDLDVPPPSGTLARSKTTINVPANARERIMAATAGAAGVAASSQPTSPRGATGPPAAASLARSNTSITPGRPGGAGLPVRGLSVRRPGPDDAGAPPPKPPKASPSNPRMTEFYDSFVDSYSDQPAPPVPSPAGGDRVANWARNAGGPPPARAMSTYGGSTRSGTIKRRVTRRAAASVYDEDEEGYVTGSGEWDEVFELTKIRVKIHFEDDVRGMALDPETPFAEFMQRVADKFETNPRALALKFRDEDGGKVTLRDESDYELAIETARESAKGKPEGKLELWCEAK
ncbi:hypothetical protein BC834DRAFT_971957 [Gloeopeniophorella convolvens]|nr:hypothetical protein BC834DRAFT_971957 [Gloeopeniophorella convolvens]